MNIIRKWRDNVAYELLRRAKVRLAAEGTSEPKSKTEKAVQTARGLVNRAYSFDKQDEELAQIILTGARMHAVGITPQDSELLAKIVAQRAVTAEDLSLLHDRGYKLAPWWSVRR